MSPHADPADGRLTFVLAYRPTRLSTFAILPKTMDPKGDFVHDAGVQEVHTRWLKIQLDRPSPAHTDGELFAEPVSQLDYRVIPACLQVLAP
jgi:diacylglycerol kinase family enzyme